MIHVYNTQNHLYWEFEFVAEDVLESMKQDSELAIYEEDSSVVQQIKQIPHPFRRFLLIENDTVSVDHALLKEDILKQLEDRRQERLKELDVLVVKASDKMLVEEDASVVAQLKDEIRGHIAEKEKWRNLRDNSNFSTISTASSYTDVMNAVLLDVDPEFIDPSDLDTVELN